MSKLATKECGPCRGDVPPLKGDDLDNLQDQLSGTWEVIAEHHLEKEFHFKNFVDALAYVNQIGALAEAANHHPEITLGWGKVRVTLFTHKIEGLAENDFILAAKFDQAYNS